MPWIDLDTTCVSFSSLLRLYPKIPRMMEVYMDNFNDCCATSSARLSVMFKENKIPTKKKNSPCCHTSS
jgi:hypothetical protein